MKNLKNVMSFITLALVMLVSFNVGAQESELSKEQISNVEKELRNGMNSFVKSVQPYYKKGMSFSSFKFALVGRGTKSTTKEGDALLNKAYDYLVKRTSSEEILSSDSGKEIAAALVFVHKNNVQNKSSNGDLVLFGNPTGDTYPESLSKVDGCRWYQIGCHLSNVWEWLVGGGADEILTIYNILCQIIGC